jgi:hypothetical protein
MPDELHSPVQVDIDRDKIKRAVKEALDDKAIEDLGKQMTGLSNQMTQGFSRIETRQDVANGKLMKHEAKIENLEKTEQAITGRTTFWQRNQDKIVWGVIGLVLTLFYYLLKNNGFPNFLSK